MAKVWLDSTDAGHHIIDFEGCAMHKGVFGKGLVQHPTWVVLNQMKCSHKFIPKVNEDRP